MEKKTPMTSFFCYPMKMIPGSPFKQATATKSVGRIHHFSYTKTGSVALEMSTNPRRRRWWNRGGGGSGFHLPRLDGRQHCLPQRSSDARLDMVICEGIGVREKLRAGWKPENDGVFRCFQKVYLFLPSWSISVGSWIPECGEMWRRWTIVFSCSFVVLFQTNHGLSLLAFGNAKLLNLKDLSRHDIVQPWWFLSNVGNDHRCQEKEATNGLP